MEITDLIKLGFNRNEAKVYFSLIKFRKADAGELIKDTKFHKNIVYDNLEKLIDKGLIGFVIEEGRRVFSLTSANRLPKFFEEKKKEIEEKKTLAESLSKEIEEKSNLIPKSSQAVIFRGISAVKSFYNQTLKGGDYIVFGAPQNSLDLMGKTFWINYNLKRERNKITVKMIFNPSLKKYGDSIKNKLTEVRYFERDFEPLTETHIQNNKVAIIVWSQEPTIFLIENENVAENYFKFFEKMWKVAKS